MRSLKVALLCCAYITLMFCVGWTANLVSQQPDAPAKQAEQVKTETTTAEANSTPDDLPVYQVVVTVTEIKGDQPTGKAWSKSTRLDAQTANNFVAGAQYVMAKAAQQNGEKTAPQGEAAVVALLTNQFKLLVAQSITELASVQAAQQALNSTNEKLNALEFKD